MTAAEADNRFGRDGSAGRLPAIAADIASRLTAAGFTDHPPLRQALALAEEVGEFVGAVRRFCGMARRTGSFDDVRHELADVVITAFVTAHEMGIDLETAIAEKVAIMHERGWRDESPGDAVAGAM